MEKTVGHGLWERELQKLAYELGPAITVFHLTPGTGKRNKIEHSKFCHTAANGITPFTKNNSLSLNLFKRICLKDRKKDFIQFLKAVCFSNFLIKAFRQFVKFLSRNFYYGFLLS